MQSKFEINKDCVLETIRQGTSHSVRGRVETILGPIIKAKLNAVAIGSHLRIKRVDGGSIQAKVIGFEKEIAILSPLDSIKGLTSGAEIMSDHKDTQVLGGAHLLGTVINACGVQLSSSDNSQSQHLQTKVVHPDNKGPEYHELREIRSRFCTGIRSIDTLFTLGRGQRIAVFAEPGVGKTSLLGAIANNSDAEINVIALIGERGREVREFAENILDRSTRDKTVIVASTSSDSASMRVQAALLATAIAEYFRDMGKHVLLSMDSLTRLFRSYRELGLAAGEIPVRGGYPPSVFEQLPKLIERSGATSCGSITAIYSVLLTEHFEQDPMAEEIKGLSDGHIYLRKHLAEQGQYPAISILESLSRLYRQLTSAKHQQHAMLLMKFKSYYEEKKDLLLFSEGQSETLAKLEAAHSKLEQFLAQNISQKISFEQSLRELISLSPFLAPSLPDFDHRSAEEIVPTLQKGS